MAKKERLIELLENMAASELLEVWREYCNNTNNYDDEIYDIDMFDEVCDGQSPSWIANRIHYGDYYPTAEFFKFDGYGNIQSIYAYEIASYIDIGDMAEYILDNEDSLYNDEIQEILDEDEDEDESESEEN